MQRAILFCVLVLFSLGLSAPASGADPNTVKVGYIPIGDCLQLYVAEDLGFFNEAGIIVETKPMKGGAVIAPAVEAGEANVGWSNTISIIIAHDKGFNFEFLTSGAISSEPENRVHSLLVQKGSAIKSVADLKGKTVAINTLGNINELSMVALLDRNGMKKKDIRLVEVPFPSMEAALKNGAVDAILAVEPFVTLTQSHGAGEVLVKSVHASYGEQFMIGGWFAKRNWITKHPKLAMRFQQAINKASDWIAANPDKLAPILVAHTKLTEGLVDKITLPAFSSTFHAEDLQRMIDMTAQYKFIKKAYPATLIVTPSALK